jgi:hypothetical protein
MKAILIATVAALVASPLARSAREAAPAVMSSQSATFTGDVFDRYEDALNSHDANVVASFWELDRASEAATRARWEGERAFEAATHAVFRISAKSLGGDAFEVTQNVNSDFYDALITGTRTTTFTVHVRGGKFHDAEPGPATDATNYHDQRKAMFEVWIAKNRPDQANVVMNDGVLVFNGKTAPLIMDLVREWKNQRDG